MSRTIWGCVACSDLLTHIDIIEQLRKLSEDLVKNNCMSQISVHFR